MPLREPARASRRFGRLLFAGALASWLAAAPAHADPSAPGATVRLADHGGVCDGRTDNSRAIARALARASELRAAVLIPAGICAFGDVIRVDGVTLTGSGEASVLHALNWRRGAIFMSGDSPTVSRLRLTGVPAPRRQADWEMTKIVVFGATDYVIDRVAIEGGPAAGIQTARGATRGRITNNVVRNTLADGIHLTDGASHILVEGNLVESTGDDGIAVVSYRRDPVRVSKVIARNNVVRNNRWGRNMSVVGGEHVRYENNLLSNNLAGLACLYIAQEESHATRGAMDVEAVRNTLENCGGARWGHGAAMVFSDGGEANQHIRLVDNDIRPGGQVGIRVAGPLNRDVRLQTNRITGTSRPLDVRSPLVSIVPYGAGPVGYVSR